VVTTASVRVWVTSSGSSVVIMAARGGPSLYFTSQPT
jgi:hypothetical protein